MTTLRKTLTVRAPSVPRIFWDLYKKIFVLSFLTFQAYGSAAYAQNDSSQLFETIDINELKILMEAEDYNIKVDGEMIVWKIDGYNSALLFRNNGETLLFYSGFTDAEVSLKKVNDWNRSILFSRSYLDEDGDPILEHTLKLTGGVTQKRILNFVSHSRDLFVSWIQEVIR